MRPIKFRAWNKEDRRMIDLHKITPLALAIDPSIVGAGIGVYVPDDKRLVLMQFTSLHDPNGKEIWEGDLASFLWGDPAERVIFKIEYLDSGFYCVPLSEKTPEGQGVWKCHLYSCIENHKENEFNIIGNIFEHPELLEGK